MSRSRCTTQLATSNARWSLPSAPERTASAATKTTSLLRYHLSVFSAAWRAPRSQCLMLTQELERVASVSSHLPQPPSTRDRVHSVAGAMPMFRQCGLQMCDRRACFFRPPSAASYLMQPLTIAETFTVVSLQITPPSAAFCPILGAESHQSPIQRRNWRASSSGKNSQRCTEFALCDCLCCASCYVDAAICFGFFSHCFVTEGSPSQRCLQWVPQDR